MHKKHIPIRKCAGCFQSKPKNEFIRIVRSPSNEENIINISIDKTGKLQGRGSYVCNDPNCLKAACKARRFERAFSCKIPREIYQKLEEEFLGEKT